MINIIMDYWLNEWSRWLGVDVKGEMIRWGMEFAPKVNVTVNYYSGDKNVKEPKTD